MKVTNVDRGVCPPIPSVNFHLWTPCNMHCKFRFAIFEDVKRDMKLPKGHLPKQECLSLIDKISDVGFEKITFAGGEPQLCPWLLSLIVRAKGLGIVLSSPMAQKSPENGESAWS